MKQLELQGVRPGYVTAAIAPIDMPDDVVTLCKDEADAVRYSISFAQARFGFTQLEIANRCGWKRDSYISEIKGGSKEMPKKRLPLFLRATGCNLLQQYRNRVRAQMALAGKPCPREQAAAVVARMLATYDMAVAA